MTDKEIEEAMQFLNDSWPHKPLSDATEEIWGQELVPYENSDVMRILIGLARTSKFRPVLAEIIGPLSPDTTEQASLAFKKLLSSFLYPPGDREHRLTPATVEAVRRLGGFGIVGIWKHENMGLHQKEFERVYWDAVESGSSQKTQATPARDMLKGKTGGEPIALPAKPEPPDPVTATKMSGLTDQFREMLKHGNSKEAS